MKDRLGAVVVLAGSIASWTPVAAQGSASFELSEHVFNSGGAPDGSAVASAGYSLSLVSIGEGLAGAYNLYRDTLGSLSGLGYGACERQGLATNSATDSDAPASGGGFFYLVTAKNPLREEGTKGSDSDGLERTGTACP